MLQKKGNVWSDSERAIIILNFCLKCIRDLYDENVLKDDEFEKLNRYISNVSFSITEDYDRYLHTIVSESDLFNRRYIDYEQSKNSRGR